MIRKILISLLLAFPFAIACWGAVDQASFLIKGAMIADGTNPLRIHTAAYVAWANREAANAELDAALLSLLESTE